MSILDYKKRESQTTAQSLLQQIPFTFISEFKVYIKKWLSLHYDHLSNILLVLLFLPKQQHKGTDSMWTLNPTIDWLVCPPTHAQLGSDLGILEAKPTPRTYVVKPFLSHFALPSLHMCTYELWLPITLLLIHYLRFLDHFWKIVYTADLKPCFDPIV